MGRRAGIATVVLALAACGTSGNNGEATPATTPTTTPPSSSVATVVPQATAPASPTTGSPEDQLRWYVKTLNGTAELSEDRYADRFDATFRDELPFEQFLGFTNQLSTGAPFTIDSITPDPPDIDKAEGDAVVATLVAGDGTAVQLRLATDASGHIVDLAIIESTETPEPSELPDTLSRTGALLAQYGQPSWVAATVNLDAPSIDLVKCTSTEGDRSTETVGVGAAMKVWVLGAVADAVMAQQLDWDTQLVLTAHDKSLPPGVLRERPDDTPITVGDAAKMLFEYSDNTAADLLIRTVGRDKVQAAQERWGGTHGDLNDPFLTTREMFVLKTAAPEVGRRFLDGDHDERTAMLDEIDTVFADQIPADVLSNGPTGPAELNWFASTTDICTGLARLVWAGQNVEGLDELDDIVTINHGVPDDNAWAMIAYAGGSEPGQLTMAWVTQGVDERWYGYAANLVNSDEEFDTAEPTLLMAAGRDLLAVGLTSPADDTTPEATAPNTTTPQTASPNSTAPGTTAPGTTAPGTTAPPTTTSDVGVESGDR